jgi:hypothetical protein
MFREDLSRKVLVDKLQSNKVSKSSSLYPRARGGGLFEGLSASHQSNVVHIMTDIAIKLAQQVSSDLFAISHSALDGRRLPLSKTLTHRCLISCRVLTIGRRLPLSKKRHSSPCRTPNTTSTLRPPITKRRCSGAAALHTEKDKSNCEKVPPS